MSVYRSAWRLMRGLKMIWRQAVHVMSRTSLGWSQALSATIMMCLLITRAPSSDLAQSAITELDDILDLFKTATSMARPAAHLVGTIQRLHKKAHDAVNRCNRGVENALSNTELDFWAGIPYMLSKDGPSYSCADSRLSDPVTRVEAEYQWSDAQVSNMHPTLVQAMRHFDARSPSFDWFFDLPTTGTPQPQPVLRSLAVETSDHNLYSSAEYHGFQPQSHHSAFLQPAPILDATWHTLAEQLGF
ncbi:hypothetical protein C0992_008003 [Termitomyces sp. T32_za158]|nr:hypothetical protein C0992_008003 [Termitomyces sp. T32_za158]